jgi:hypothetical protein
MACSKLWISIFKKFPKLFDDQPILGMDLSLSLPLLKLFKFRSKKTMEQEQSKNWEI